VLRHCVASSFPGVDLLITHAIESANMDGIAAKTMNRVAERLEPRLLAARGELYAAIRDAHAERATFATIASVAGLSREWVRRIVKER
jgi:hypothetical protein